MKTTYFFTIVFFALMGCSSQEESKVVSVEKHQTAASPVIKANEILKMEIEGMVCEMGCGASIRKELKSTNAVNSVEFDYEEGRKSNTAKIAFDNHKISADKLVKLVEKINDKQFKVSNISSEPCHLSDKQECKSQDTDCKKESSLLETQPEDSSIDVATSEMEIPNFLHIITTIFVN